MNPAVKTKWVAALRSGEYKQSKGRLRDTSRQEICHCVFGVLTDICVKDTKQTWEEVTKSMYSLSSRVKDWSGLNGLTPARVKIGILEASVMRHNDEGRSFLELADAIESQL